MPEGKKTSDNDKLMGVLAYLGILVLIPLLAAKDSKFAQFHAKQGLTLFAGEVILFVLNWIVTIILFSSFAGLGIGSLLSLVLWVIGVGFLVLSIIGIINVVNGEQKPLPLIGGIKLMK
jgi:uncharacterized membrane protein